MTPVLPTWRRQIGALLGCAAILMTTACGGSSSDTADDTSPTEVTPTPSPGTHLVRGHRLYAQCSGAGSPTVVFLHGLGGAGADWDQAASRLKDLRTCWYDRLNVGRSDASKPDERHSALDSVEDLHALLAEVGAKPPYLLVGHSYGGLLAVMYGATYPDEVTGMVLADATSTFEPSLDPPGTAGDVKADMDSNGENLDAYEGYAQARKLEESLPDVPITYIWAAGNLDEDLPKEWSRTAYARKLRAWVADLAEGRLVTCDCSHQIPRQDPEIVVDEVRRILARAE